MGSRGYKPTKEVAKKRARAVDLWLKGLTYAAIGKAIGVSRQRAQQLIAPPPGVLEAARKAAGGRCRDCRVQIENGHVHGVNADGGGAPEDFSGVTVYVCASCHVKRHHPVSEAVSA